MWQWLKNLLLADVLRVAGFFATLFSVVGLVLGIRKSGRDAERVENLKKQSERVGVAHEIENENRRIPDGGAADRLRDRWSRD